MNIESNFRGCEGLSVVKSMLYKVCSLSCDAINAEDHGERTAQFYSIFQNEV